MVIKLNILEPSDRRRGQQETVVLNMLRGGRCGKTLGRRGRRTWCELVKVSMVYVKGTGVTRGRRHCLIFSGISAGRSMHAERWASALVEDSSRKKATCQPITLHCTIIHTDPHRTCDNMSFRKSISRFGKKMKDRLGIGDRREGRAASVGGEGSDRPSLSLRSEPGTVLRGEVRGEDTRASGREDNPVPQPGDSGSIARGRDPGRSDDHADEGETDQKRPHVATEDLSGQGRTDQANTPPRSDVGNRTPTPPISQGGESEGM